MPQLVYGLHGQVLYTVDSLQVVPVVSCTLLNSVCATASLRTTWAGSVHCRLTSSGPCCKLYTVEQRVPQLVYGLLGQVLYTVDSRQVVPVVSCTLLNSVCATASLRPTWAGSVHCRLTSSGPCCKLYTVEQRVPQLVYGLLGQVLYTVDSLQVDPVVSCTLLNSVCHS